MKKITSILIAFIYLFLSTGLVVHMHYCQDHLQSVSLFGEAQKCCCWTPGTDNNCCSDRQFVVQMDQEDQIIPSSVPVISDLQAFIIYSTCFTIEKKGISLQTVLLSYDLPPPRLPAWKLNSAFLFYG